MALHAKAKAEAGCRFYALYDKISREDILAHAYAQCRSNKGAPGVDGQDFADIDAYGVQRWLGELAIALRQETYRPEPIRRVFAAPPPTTARGFVPWRLSDAGQRVRGSVDHRRDPKPCTISAVMSQRRNRQLRADFVAEVGDYCARGLPRFVDTSSYYAAFWRAVARRPEI
jgi:hypothetical protein